MTSAGASTCCSGPSPALTSPSCCAETWLKPAREDDNPWGLLKLAAERTQDPRWRNPPWAYHNGGIWPFIGGYYVMALVKMGRTDEARAVMERLVEANAQAENGRWG